MDIGVLLLLIGIVVAFLVSYALGVVLILVGLVLILVPYLRRP